MVRDTHALTSLGRPLFQFLEKIRRRYPHYLHHGHELHHIQSPLTALKPCHERLMPIQHRSQLFLRQIQRFPCLS